MPLLSATSSRSDALPITATDTQRPGGSADAKILLDPNPTSSEVMREVTPLTRVCSPNVVRLEGVQLLSLSGSQRAALIFEHITGGDVWGAIRAGAWPAPDEVAGFAAGALRGLAALHAHEVVHRDVKPHNIALREADWTRPVLLDLGLGRLLDESTKTFYPQALGTAPFMAPEVVEGRPARKGSDLWSLGVVASSNPRGGARREVWSASAFADG